MGWKPVRNVNVTVRDGSPYKEVIRTVYHKPRFGTYIRYKCKRKIVSLTRFNNTAYTL